jgi:hypothetical protein
MTGCPRIRQRLLSTGFGGFNILKNIKRNSGSINKSKEFFSLRIGGIEKWQRRNLSERNRM